MGFEPLYASTFGARRRNVCWASAYPLSTMVNVHFDVTMPVHKELLAFDPYFIYTAMNDGQYLPCESGLYTSTALYNLGNYGTMRDIFSPDFSCDYLWTDPITGNLVPGAMVNFYAANPFKGFDDYFKVKKNGKWLDQMNGTLQQLPCCDIHECWRCFCK